MRPTAANLNRKPVQTGKTVGDIISRRHALSLFENDHIKIILPMLQENDIPAAGVLDEHGRLQGLLTERGILRHIFAYSCDRFIHGSNMKKYLDDMLVRDAMFYKPETLRDDMCIEEAASLMLKRGYRFMPVVSRYDSSHFLGIVGERELAAQLHECVEELKRSETTHKAILSYMLAEPYGRGAEV